MSKSRGFTLIELLITISIIAVLSAMALVLYSTIMKQGRDSKRQSDLRSIQSALEQYNNDQGFYPRFLNSTLSPTNFDSSLTSSTANTSPPSPIKTYLNNIPNDSSYPYSYYARVAGNPPAGNDCDYSVAAPCTSYCLYAHIENPPSPLPAAPAGCPYSGTYNFVLTPP